MKSLILILPLISAASSPKSDNLSACEFISPLADFEIVRNETLLHFPNGTFKIPLQKVPSGKRSSLYFNENELFYWNSVRKRNVYTKGKVGIASQNKIRDCLNGLMKKHPSSKFIKGVGDCFCTKTDWAQGSIHRWQIDSHCGNFMDFEYLKKVMKITNATADAKIPRPGGRAVDYWARRS